MMLINTLLLVITHYNFLNYKKTYQLSKDIYDDTLYIFKDNTWKLIGEKLKINTIVNTDYIY